MNYKLQIQKRNNAGYTIIETMIAISLFLVIVVTGMGALLSANALHQKSQSLSSITDSLSFIMEDMSKNLRTGYGYHCFISGDIIPSTTSNTVSVPKSCQTGSAIAFETATGSPSNDVASSTGSDGQQCSGSQCGSDNDQWIYYIGQDTSLPGNPLAIWKSTAGPYVMSSFIKLTPDEVVIDPASSFSVLGAEVPPGDKQQPLITIRLLGKITVKGVDTPFSLQTSVSQRQLDI